MKRKLVYLVLLLSLFGGVGAAAAQDPQPELTPEATEVVNPPAPDHVETPADDINVPPVPDFEEVYNAGYMALLAAFAGLVSFLATTPLISILKRIPPFNLKNSNGEPLLSADQINLIVALAFSAITWGASALGYREQVTTIWKLVFAALPILAGAGANYFANQKAYNAVKGSIPVVGYERPKTLKASKGELGKF